MIYKQFGDWQLSYLGMGNMRLPTTMERGPIDKLKAREIIEYVYSQGVNYFDTAFRYHEGVSELFSGEVLNQYPRDTWHLTTKFPGHMLRREGEKLAFTGFGEDRIEYFDSVQQIFQSQLEKCAVDYFDFYLLHGLTDGSLPIYGDPELGIIDYLLERKKAGQIRHLGFSSHDRAEAIDRFLTRWKGVFEVVQIQINYLDWTLQDAKKKYEVITSHGLPVIAMEPVRGGRLANVPAEAEALMKAARPGDSPAKWALRFLQGLPGIMIILSGMSTIEQAIENARTMSEYNPVTEDDKAILQKVVWSMENIQPCTACRYCCEACPSKLDIPRLLALSSEAMHDGRIESINSILSKMSDDEKPSACIACGACAPLCPQEIDIPAELAKFAGFIANPPPPRR